MKTHDALEDGFDRNQTARREKDARAKSAKEKLRLALGPDVNIDAFVVRIAKKPISMRDPNHNVIATRQGLHSRGNAVDIASLQVQADSNWSMVATSSFDGIDTVLEIGSFLLGQFQLDDFFDPTAAHHDRNSDVISTDAILVLIRVGGDGNHTLSCRFTTASTIWAQAAAGA